MTLTGIYSVLLVCCALYYVRFIFIAYRGLANAQHPPDAPPKVNVSVIVAARNEEASIARCLSSLQTQDYPSHLLEIIIVDDGSSDATPDMVRSAMATDRRISFHQLDKDSVWKPSRKRGRKPEALARGIAHAVGEIVIMTDADCEPPPEWVRTLVSAISGDVVYAIGPVLERTKPSFFGRIRALEVLGLTGMAGGRIGAGRPINSLGGNVAFRRELYARTGGFNFSEVKSDEETMMHTILELRLGRVVFLPFAAARVFTESPPSVRSFWNQRKRWGSMHGRFRNKAILLELTLLYLSLLLPVASVVLGIWNPAILWAAGGFFAAKAGMDLLMLRRCARMFGEPFSAVTFIAAEFMHTLFLVVVSALAQVTPYSWKNRSVLTIDPVHPGS